MERKRSLHPGLHVILDKVHRGVSLTDEELEQLQRQLRWLEAREREDREEAERFDPVETPTIRNLISGHATREGVERFAVRSGTGSIAFYRAAQDIEVSSVGIGTYLGAMDRATDRAYVQAIQAALEGGINLVDTSLNYRHQRSERAVATAIRGFIESGNGQRDEIIVCTKGGFLVPGALTSGTLDEADVVAGIHSIAPAFIADQIARSRANLGLETIDVYYLHNPETQLDTVETPEFLDRIRSAFNQLERSVSDGYIRYYGSATWNGYRGGRLSLWALAEIAREVAGDDHHFRFVQLPFNLGMQEARLHQREGEANVLDLAAELKMTVIASASLLQGRLVCDLPKQVATILDNGQSERSPPQYVDS